MANKHKSDRDDSYDPEAWFGLLSDADRAAVLRTRIAEVEATRRKRIEADAQVRRALVDTEGYHFVRGLFVAVMGVTVIASAIVAYHWVELHGSTPAPSTVGAVPDAGLSPGANR